jgi:hypothetical protein
VSPDWLGNPQHVIAGAVLAFAVAHVARRWIPAWWARVGVAVGVTLAAEIFVELAEYVAYYRDGASAEEYYDTLADLVASLVGALAGAGVSVVMTTRRS